jgi:hypothetical protein
VPSRSQNSAQVPQLLDEAKQKFARLMEARDETVRHLPTSFV